MATEPSVGRNTETKRHFSCRWTPPQEKHRNSRYIFRHGWSDSRKAVKRHSVSVVYHGNPAFIPVPWRASVLEIRHFPSAGNQTRRESPQMDAKRDGQAQSSKGRASADNGLKFLEEPSTQE
jgi:hypothetical protein